MPDPFDDTPMLHPFFGEPESVSELVNKYGTYNIQPTAEAENAFPSIAQGLPKKWRDVEVTKSDLQT